MSPARYSIFDVFSCTRSKKSCSWGSGFQIMLFNKKSMSQFFSKWDLLHLVILRIFVITLRFESWYLDASHNFQAVLWITKTVTQVLNVRRHEEHTHEQDTIAIHTYSSPITASIWYVLLSHYWHHREHWWHLLSDVGILYLTSLTYFNHNIFKNISVNSFNTCYL